MRNNIPFLLILFIIMAGCSKKPEEIEPPGKDRQIKTSDNTTASKSKKKKEQKVKKVRIKKITKGTVEKKINYNAVVEAQRDVVLTAQSVGEITKHNFDIGKFVSRGSLLAVIDPEARKSSLDKAELALKQAELALELKEKVYERDKKLYDNKSITQEQFEISENSLRQAQLNIEQAQNAFQMAKINYQHCFVRAPFSGVIVEKTSQLGQYVSIGMPIARLVDTNNLQVVVGLTSKDMLIYKKSEKKQADILLPDGTVVPGVIKGVAEAPEKATSLFPIKIKFKSIKDNITHKKVLFPGMHIKVALFAKAYKDVFEIGRSVLKLENQRYYLFVFEDGKSLKKEVVVLDDNAENMIVRIANMETDSFDIVISGQEALKDGMTVELLGSGDENQ